MSNSIFCIEQRLKEQQRNKKILSLAIIGSVLTHTAIAGVITNLPKPETLEKEPIAIVMLEKPQEKPKPVAIKKVEPPVAKPAAVKKVEPVAKPVAIKKVEPVAKPVAPKITRPTQARTIAKAPEEPRIARRTQITQPLPRNNSEPQNNVNTSIPVSRQPTPLTSTDTDVNAKPFLSANEPSTLRSGELPEAGIPNSLASNSPVVSSSRPSAPRSNTQALADDASIGREGLKSNLGNGPGGGDPAGKSNSPSGVRDNVAQSISSNSFGSNSSGAPKPSVPAKTTAKAKTGLSCIRQCDPPYPSVLQGAEGEAVVAITIDPKGNVTSVVLSRANSNAEINQQALQAAKKMKFTSPSEGKQAKAQITVNFTVAGSAFDRQARDKKNQQDKTRQVSKEQQEQQLQLEQERQLRQKELEKERLERQKEFQIPSSQP